MQKLAIIGSGDLGQQIAYHAVSDCHYNVAGFFDDFEIKGSIKGQIPVLGGIDDIRTSYGHGEFDAIMIGIGYKHFQKRQELFDELSQHLPFGSILHSSSYIDKSCHIGKGVFIYPGCILDMNVFVGDNVLLNAGCVIAHDTLVGNHTFFSPAVRVAGFVKIGECVSLGIGTTIIDNIKINSNIRTGAGTVVVNNLEQSGLYVGIPGKLIKS